MLEDDHQKAESAKKRAQQSGFPALEASHFESPHSDESEPGEQRHPGQALPLRESS